MPGTQSDRLLSCDRHAATNAEQPPAGFEATVWITPFAEPASAAYREGRALGHWLRRADGEPHVVTWWQGEGVALNVSDSAALAWIEARLRRLMATTGVAGFKFDAGEAQFVPPGAMANPNEYCALWAAFAARFGGGGEVRCACGSQGAGLWTREFDKDSRWSHHNGLRALVTSALHLSVLGYPFVLPDMVGGNAYSDDMLGSGGDGDGDGDGGGDGGGGGGAGGGASFSGMGDGAGGERAGGAGRAADDASTPPAAAAAEQPLSSLFYGALPARELYVRWCGANALLPAVQFSIAPWQYDEAASDACRKALAMREARLPLLEALADRAASHGEPIVRPLWWHDPLDPTCQWVDDEFLLGNATLVAPVLEPGVASRPVYLPGGEWLEANSARRRRHRGPAWLVDHAVPLGDVAIFELVDW